MRNLIRRRKAASDLPQEVWVLAAVAFSVALGFGIVAPVIPVFARRFGVGQTAAGLVISAFAFMRLVFGPAAGALVNRLGERLIMSSGIGIVAVSSLLTGLAANYQQMLALRAIGGVGSVMFTVSAQSLMLRSVPPDRRGRASSMYSGGFLLGGLTGPVLGGVFGGISLRLPFFLYAATLALAGAIALVRLGGRRPTAVGESAEIVPQTSLRQALRHPAYQAALTVNTGVGWAIFGTRSSLVPLFVVDVLHRGPLWIGLGLLSSSLTDVALLYPVGRLADSVGRRPMLIAGTACGVGATAMLAFVPHLAAFVVAMSLYGATSSLLSVSPSAVVGDILGGRGGTVVAAYGMSSDLGAVTGPLVTGALAQHISYRAAFTSTASVLALGLLMSVRMPETLRRAGDGSAEGVAQVGDQIGDVLYPDGQADQVGGHLQS
jgi:MFS family permease